MSKSLVDLMTGPRRPDLERVYGVVTAVVTNNQDPDKLGRVRVRFGWLSEQDESWWARVATPMAGNDRGVYLLPEVDDEVLVAFEHGDVRFPYVVGALWNGDPDRPNKPPETNDDGENNRRTIKSRSGHVICLDDADSQERIEIVLSGGKATIVLNKEDKTITISAEGDLVLESTDGKLRLLGNGIEMKSQAEVTVEAANDLGLKADGQATLKGSVVNIN